MSAIPIVTFGAVILFAVISLLVKRERATSQDAKDAFADLSGILLSKLPTMGLVVAYRQPADGWNTTMSGRKRSGEEVAKLIIKLIPPLMRVVISLGLATAGLWIVLSHAFTPEEKHWGFTTLGTILGYWLKH